MSSDVRQWNLMIVMLTESFVDLIKLAVTDVGTNMSPGYDGGTWTSTMHKDSLGCVILVKFDLRAESRETAWSLVKEALNKRGVQFIAFRLGNEDLGSISGVGNMTWKKQEPTQSVYRSPGSVV